jgi:glycine cleavage system regulatory protein
MTQSLVVTVTGADRPGIVSQVSDRAKEHGANWEASRMVSLAGQFAGIVHLQVPEANAQALGAALSALSASGLHIAIAGGEPAGAASPRRSVKLDLFGNDRPGIMRDLSTCLANQGVSIEKLHTEIVSAPMSADHLFKVSASLAVPDSLSDDALRRSLESLANEMMVDIALGEPD